MKVTIIGTGYVGLTTGVALAHLGHAVTCVDRDAARIASLNGGALPLHEPGLAGLFREASSGMRFTADLTSDAAAAEAILICVGTPSRRDGGADLSDVEAAAERIGAVIPPGRTAVVANKSTVPVGSAARVRQLVESALRRRGVTARIGVAANPEFLREGAALLDTFYPDRIVVGTDEGWVADRLRSLYAPILERRFTPPAGIRPPEGAPLPHFVTTGTASAELAKYAANTFLALKVSFANEVAGISEKVGADIVDVMRTVGLDRRIGPQYLGAGAGWGGSCFGKDLRALLSLAARHGCEMPLAEAAMRVNARQRRSIAAKVEAALQGTGGSVVAIWGLTFKPDTDDLRDAPAIDVARRLIDRGARVRVHDPMGMPRLHRCHPDLAVECADSPLAAARGADAVVLMTEWEAFLHVDWPALAAAMRRPVVVDARNALDRTALLRLGFDYRGVGR